MTDINFFEESDESAVQETSRFSYVLDGNTCVTQLFAAADSDIVAAWKEEITAEGATDIQEVDEEYTLPKTAMERGQEAFSAYAPVLTALTQALGVAAATGAESTEEILADLQATQAAAKAAKDRAISQDSTAASRQTVAFAGTNGLTLLRSKWCPHCAIKMVVAEVDAQAKECPVCGYMVHQ